MLLTQTLLRHLPRGFVLTNAKKQAHFMKSQQDIFAKIDSNNQQEYNLILKTFLLKVSETDGLKLISTKKVRQSQPLHKMFYKKSWIMPNSKRQRLQLEQALVLEVHHLVLSLKRSLT